jgi:hypothetical protein
MPSNAGLTFVFIVSMSDNMYSVMSIDSTLTPALPDVSPLELLG